MIKLNGRKIGHVYTVPNINNLDNAYDDDMYAYDDGDYQDVEILQEPQKHGVTAQNHHAVLSRTDTLAPGIKQGDEFALPGAGRYTAMFQGDG